MKKEKRHHNVVSFFIFATSFGAKNALCRIWRLLSQVVEEEFGLFLGIG
jgi:hypothetical protein